MRFISSPILLTAAVILNTPRSVVSSSGGTCDAADRNPDCAPGVRDVVFDEALNDYEQDDPRLVEFIRDKILVGPSEPDVPYNFPKPSFRGAGFLAAQYGQPTAVDE